VSDGRRYPLIFNPRARSERGQRVSRFLMQRAPRFALYATNAPEEAGGLAARFAADGEPVVIAAGGDGTLNAVVRGLAGTQTALGVLPAGTMNVFARELGIPFGNFARAFDVIERGHVREIDLFAANGTPFVQMAGVGYDAQVIEETTWETKKMFGPLAYLFSAVRVLGEQPPRMVVECADGRSEEGVCVIAGNGSLYGGQFKLFRKADNQDSMLDVLVFKEAGYKLVVESLRGIAKGGVDLGASTMSYLQAGAFRVHCDREVPVEVDGELLGRAREVEFAAAERRLKVVAPERPVPGVFADAMAALTGGWSKILQPAGDAAARARHP
jgi:YegS/Rv2252/BmrU family lipid kinase